MNIWVMRTVKVPLNHSKVMGLDIMIRYNELEEIRQLLLTILEVNLKKEKNNVNGRPKNYKLAVEVRLELGMWFV